MNLTPKQHGFVQTYLETGNATKSALEHYDTDDARVAQAIGSENLSKPLIREAIDDAYKMAKATIVSLAAGADNENVRLNAAKDIVDRAEGKAVSRSINAEAKQTTYVLPEEDRKRLDAILQMNRENRPIPIE